MPYNPMVFDGRVLDLYPRLRRIEAYSEIPDLRSAESMSGIVLTEKDLDTCIRFCILYVEPRGNPLAMESDLLERAKMAWESLKVPKSSPLRKFQEDQHWWFSLMIFEYFKLTHNTIYTHWFALKSAMHSNARILVGSGDGDFAALAENSTKAGKFMDTYVNKIRDLELILFKDDTFADIVTIETFFTNRIPEQNALQWETKKKRILT